MKAVVLALSLGLGLVALTPSLAVAGKSERVVVKSDRTLPQIEEYVETVDQRLARGKYDVVLPADRAWIVSELESIKGQLQKVGAGTAQLPDLRANVDAFETRMIDIEEGGIVCEKSRRTGTRMVEKRCTTRKRQAEVREDSRDSMRNLGPRVVMPSGG
jgi:hypothetical protein